MSRIGTFGRAAAMVVTVLAGMSASTDALTKEPLAKNLFGAKKLPAVAEAAILRLLHQGLLHRRRGDRHRRADLAGDAAVAQPPLGPSRR